MLDDIYVLDKNLELVTVIDSYKSCIWANRYKTVGDCELYVEATTEALTYLKKGYYLMRMDDSMVCRIRKVELDTDSESGNYLIVTGYDVKDFLFQRVIWGTRIVDGNVEDFLRTIINESLGNPSLSARQLKKQNGQRLFYLGNKSNFTEVITEQNSYDNIGTKVEEVCAKYDWGYRVVLSSNAFYFQLYKGTDRTDEVTFSNDFENLLSTKYIEDDTNMGNVALVAGQGEGSERTRNVSGYAESTNRYEIYVDARDLSSTIKWSDLIAMYPTTDQGGQGSIQSVSTPGGGYYYVYQMDYIDIAIVDSDQLTNLRTTYPNGTQITRDGNTYYRVYSVAIADLPSNEMTSDTDVELRDIIYSVYLLNRGYEKLSEYGSVKSFEGSVEPSTTYTYKTDYFLGDKVTVENEFGISVEARIVEVVEVNDENGYSIEPKFEYLEIS